MQQFTPSFRVDCSLGTYAVANNTTLFLKNVSTVWSEESQASQEALLRFLASCVRKVYVSTSIQPFQYRLYGNKNPLGMTGLQLPFDETVFNLIFAE